jgi:hypothetical protein
MYIDSHVADVMFIVVSVNRGEREEKEFPTFILLSMRKSNHFFLSRSLSCEIYTLWKGTKLGPPWLAISMLWLLALSLQLQNRGTERKVVLRK